VSWDWRCSGDEATAAYFQAYRAALDHPIPRTPPVVAQRLRATLPPDEESWLAWAEGQVQSLPAGEEASLRQGWHRFVDLMRATRPERPEGFYRIVRVGSVDIGIGSALEPKTLIRIAGPSDAPGDDLLLEARVTSTNTADQCVSRPPNGGSMHVLMFATLLGSRLPDVFGFMPREGARDAPELWIQSWDRGYRELSVADVKNQAELNELAVDAARQLAGHFWTTFPEPLRGHLRFGQLRAFEMTETRARETARRFADETLREWERFRRQR
jgi:hypothetical protein